MSHVQSLPYDINIIWLNSIFFINELLLQTSHSFVGIFLISYRYMYVTIIKHKCVTITAPKMCVIQKSGSNFIRTRLFTATLYLLYVKNYLCHT